MLETVKFKSLFVQSSNYYFYLIFLYKYAIEVVFDCNCVLEILLCSKNIKCTKEYHLRNYLKFNVMIPGPFRTQHSITYSRHGRWQYLQVHFIEYWKTSYFSQHHMIYDENMVGQNNTRVVNQWLGSICYVCSDCVFLLIFIYNSFLVCQL